MKIYFINSKQPECGVYQYGLRYWDAIKNTNLNVEYVEISTEQEFLSLDFSDVHVVFFNWIEGGSTGPFGWLNHDLTQNLRDRNITTISVLHTNNCFSTTFDNFVDQNPFRSGMPRPLYAFDTSKEKPNNKIINIGSFGFAGPHKNFPEIVRLVNEQFESAQININVTNAFYGDVDKTVLNQVLEDIHAVPRKPGIELNVTTDFLSNEELLDFVHNNDLIVFAYDYVGDIASVVDYVISTETPIAVTSISSFSHVYTEQIDIHKHSLRDILDFNLKTSYIKQFKSKWSNQKLQQYFERIMTIVTKQSYAQVCQDLFALKLIGTNGFFLDLGAGWDEFSVNSNTVLLEEFGWDGISVEGNIDNAHRRNSRAIKSTTICTYIPDTTIKEILDEHNAPTVIDYVSIDIEPMSITALNNFPFDEYEFKVLTFEHDLYASNSFQKDEAYKLLTERGYFRLCNNVNVPEAMGLGLYFEDWWINPKHFSKEFIENNTFDGQLGTHITSNIRI